MAGLGPKGAQPHKQCAALCTCADEKANLGQGSLAKLCKANCLQVPDGPVSNEAAVGHTWRMIL